MRIPRRTGPVLAALGWALAQAPGAAQLSVVSFEPAFGTVGVEGGVRVTITFSAPLDTLFVPSRNTGFFVGMVTAPDPGPPRTIEVSDDGMTLGIGLELQPETQYWVAIHEARSVDGDLLGRPHATTFTTAQSLPTGIVSGSVTGDRPAATMVLLVPPAGLFGERGGAVGGYAVPDSGGRFEIPYVPDGTYYCVALADVNGSGAPDVGEPVAFHDADLDNVADVVLVQDGIGASGVFLPIDPLRARTAAYRAAAARTKATAWMEDALPVGVRAEGVEPDGTAREWFHAFHSDMAGTGLGLTALGEWIFAGDPGGSPPDTVALPEHWIDSDVALAVAGEAIREWSEGRDAFAIAMSLARGLSPQAPARAVWLIRYAVPGTGETRTVAIDAESGVAVAREASHAGPPVAGTLGIPWPVPAANRVTIPVTAVPGTRLVLEAFDLLGRRIAEMPVATAGPVVVDVSRWARGLYLVRLVGASVGRRVVVAR